MRDIVPPGVLCFDCVLVRACGAVPVRGGADVRACVPELTQRWRVPANAIRDRGAIALSRALEESSTIASLALRGTAHGMCKFARASVVLHSVIHGLLRPLCCLCTAAMIATLHNCWRPPRRQQHWGCWRDRYRWPLDGVDDACSRPQWCARVVRVLFCSVSVFAPQDSSHWCAWRRRVSQVTKSATMARYPLPAQ